MQEELDRLIAEQKERIDELNGQLSRRTEYLESGATKDFDQEDELWQELQNAPFEVHRVGDYVTPRRAHAAVIEGERVGAAL